jgi:2-alkyl-3-oxoalkanoate reductase
MAATIDETCMIALVTGGNGFVGRYVVEQLLARGARVRVVGRSAYPELAALGVECFAVDLGAQQSLATAMRGVETVFHVAAQAGVWGRPNDFVRNNLLATQHVVRSAVGAGAARLIYTSSPSVAIGMEDIAGGDERLPYPERYLAPYPLTKAHAERFVLGQNEIAAVAIRPHLIWGPRDPHILPRLIERARSGRLVRVGPGTNLVDVTYVENAAEAHLLAAEGLQRNPALHGRAYFIGQERPVNQWEFISTLVERLNLPPIRRSVPLGIAMAMGTILERSYSALKLAHEPPVTRMMAWQMAHSHWFSHAAAERDFGYHPRISIEEGIDRTVRAVNSDE